MISNSKNYYFYLWDSEFAFTSGTLAESLRGWRLIHLSKEAPFTMVDIDEIYKACLSPEPGRTITARTVYDFVRSPFKVWCDINAPEEAKDLISEFQKLLWEQGKRHGRPRSPGRQRQTRLLLGYQPLSNIGNNGFIDT